MTTPAVSIHQDTIENWYRYLSINGGAPVLDYTGTTVTSSIHRERPESTSVTPGAGGYRDPTSWTHTKHSYRYPTCGIATQDGPNVVRYESNGGAFSKGLPDTGPFSDVLEARAVNGALEKLKRQNVNFGVAFGERAQTAKLFETNLKRIARTYRQFKRSKRGLWEKIKKINPRKEAYPSAWLELQYGVKPLVSDIYGACEELNEIERDPNAYYITMRNGAWEQSTALEDTQFAYLFGHSNRPVLCDVLREEGCFASFSYRLRNPFIAELASLGLTNPASVAWELVPFSFVFDWAVPVGDYLGLLDADFGWDYINGSTSRIKRVTGRGRHVQNMPGNSWMYDGDVTSSRFEAFRFHREVYGSPPWPRIQVRNPLSTGRVANALSLLSQALR